MGYKPSYPQAAVDNLHKKPVDSVRLALPTGEAGGWGPAGNGHGHGTPSDIF